MHFLFFLERKSVVGRTYDLELIPFKTIQDQGVSGLPQWAVDVLPQQAPHSMLTMTVCHLSKVILSLEYSFQVSLTLVLRWQRTVKSLLKENLVNTQSEKRSTVVGGTF